MKTYYYVHTGHRVGLDRFRRAVAILKELNSDITLLCSDFRIAHEARSFGIKDAVGIDVVRNIPYIANHGDRLIFDSDEANEIMLEDMRGFFSTFLHVESDEIVIDEMYFEQTKKDVELSFFFGDDDYEKDLEKNLDFLDGLELYLQLGFYYFLDYEDMLKEKFPNHFEFDEYEQMIKRTKILISASPQAVFENLASGGRPIYVQRVDYGDIFCKVFDKLNVPVIKNYNKTKLLNILDNIADNNYVKLQQNDKNLINFLKKELNL